MKLPTGVTRTFYYPARFRATKPEAMRHWRYVAHIGWRGCRYAKAFEIEKHGEDAARRMACAWREEMVARLLRGGVRPHQKLNRPGVRRT